MCRKSVVSENIFRLQNKEQVDIVFARERPLFRADGPFNLANTGSFHLILKFDRAPMLTTNLEIQHVWKSGKMVAIGITRKSQIAILEESLKQP